MSLFCVQYPIEPTKSHTTDATKPLRAAGTLWHLALPTWLVYPRNECHTAAQVRSPEIVATAVAVHSTEMSMRIVARPAGNTRTSEDLLAEMSDNEAPAELGFSQPSALAAQKPF